MMKKSARMLALTMVMVGALTLSADEVPAETGQATCKGSTGATCTGEVCCASGAYCSTDREFCHDLFCAENPESTLCKEGVS